MKQNEIYKKLLVRFDEEDVLRLEKIKETVETKSYNETIRKIIEIVYENLGGDVIKEETRIDEKTAEKIRFLDKEMLVLMEVVNAILVNTNMREFYSQDDVPSPIISKAKNHIKEKAAKAKQNADFTGKYRSYV